MYEAVSFLQIIHTCFTASLCITILLTTNQFLLLSSSAVLCRQTEHRLSPDEEPGSRGSVVTSQTLPSNTAMGSNPIQSGVLYSVLVNWHDLWYGYLYTAVILGAQAENHWVKGYNVKKLKLQWHIGILTRSLQMANFYSVHRSTRPRIRMNV